MTNLQLKVSASLKQALDKLKLSSENEGRKGKETVRLSRYVVSVTQINEMLILSFLKWSFPVIMFFFLIIWEIPSSPGNDDWSSNVDNVETWLSGEVHCP